MVFVSKTVMLDHVHLKSPMVYIKMQFPGSHPRTPKSEDRGQIAFPNSYAC